MINHAGILLRTPAALGIDKEMLFRQQEQIKAAWSLLSTLHCLLLPDKVKELGKGPLVFLSSSSSQFCESGIFFWIPDPGSKRSRIHIKDLSIFNLKNGFYAL
jgi:hypothetical protein